MSLPRGQAACGAAAALAFAHQVAVTHPDEREELGPTFRVEIQGSPYMISDQVHRHPQAKGFQ
ncbi:MAG: hypothetical protein ABJQ90_18740 [Parasphingorhabdus sp.]